MSDFDDLYDIDTYPDDDDDGEDKPQVSEWVVSVMKAEICPYCGRPPMFWSKSTDLYGGRDFWPVYVCTACQAWVGCHKGTNEPMWRLADAELRRWKSKAHEAFDRTWRWRSIKRPEAYALLGKMLDIPKEFCHIGMFSIETCKRVVAMIDVLMEEVENAEFEKSHKISWHR